MAQTKEQAKKKIATKRAAAKKKKSAAAKSKRRAGQKKRVQQKVAGNAPRAADSLFDPESVGGKIIQRRKKMNY